MCRHIILLFILICSKNLFGESYQIVGNINHLANQWVSLTYMDDSLQSKIDSTYSIDGKFIFKGSIIEPTAAGVFSNDGSLSINFFFEQGSTYIKGNLIAPKSIEVSGGRSTNEYKDYTAIAMLLNHENDSMREVAFRNENDSIAFQKYWDAYLETVKTNELKQEAWMLAHKNSMVNAYNFLYHYMVDDNLFKGDSLLRLMSEDVQHSKYSRERELVKRNTVLREIDKPVKNFTQNNIYGKPFSTQTFSGKIYLIDFWASWCKPCRELNPSLVSDYRKYHDFGFEIVSVSLDNSKTSWKAAVEKDSLIWTNVSELKAQNSVADLYDVHSLPANFLVDRKGIIIGKSLFGKRLTDKLRELFSK